MLPSGQGDLQAAWTWNYFPFLYVSTNHIYHTEIRIWYFWKSFIAFLRNQSKSKEILAILILIIITEATLPQFHTGHSTESALIISVICRVPLCNVPNEKYKPGWQEKQDGTSKAAALNDAPKLSIKLIILFFSSETVLVHIPYDPCFYFWHQIKDVKSPTPVSLKTKNVLFYLSICQFSLFLIKVKKKIRIKGHIKSLIYMKRFT